MISLPLPPLSLVVFADEWRLELARTDSSRKAATGFKNHFRNRIILQRMNDAVHKHGGKGDLDGEALYHIFHLTIRWRVAPVVRSLFIEAEVRSTKLNLNQSQCP